MEVKIIVARAAGKTRSKHGHHPTNGFDKRPMAGPGRPKGSRPAHVLWRDALKAYCDQTDTDPAEFQAMVMEQLRLAAARGKDWAIREFLDRQHGRPKSEDKLTVEGEITGEALLRVLLSKADSGKVEG